MRAGILNDNTMHRTPQDPLRNLMFFPAFHGFGGGLPSSSVQGCLVTAKVLASSAEVLVLAF